MIFVQVKPVAENKFIWNGKTEIMDGDMRFPAFGFIEQGADFEAFRLAGFEHVEDSGDGMSAVHNIFNEQYIPAANIRLQIERDTGGTGGLAFSNAIGRDGHEVHHVRYGDMPAEIHHEGHTAAQDADQQQFIRRIIRADLKAEFPDPRLQGFRIDQNFSKHIFVVLHNSFITREAVSPYERGTS